MANNNSTKELRRGWTTGAYAMATAMAAFRAMLTGAFEPNVKIILPKGQTPEFTLSTCEYGDHWTKAGAIKDAGDDPDITHGAEIISEVKFGAPNSGIIFKAGEGIGTVTLPGLPLPVGAPAINPKPREMISKAINKIAKEFGVAPDVIITISIPGGKELAKKTMNSRLGILGGLSILGTTGIVIPYSCASWINSIHRGVDVALAANLTHIVAVTGSTSEKGVKKVISISEQGLIDMGDFVGGLLKYLRKNPIANITIAGGFSKLAKLSQGSLDLHSSRSQLDMVSLSVAVQDTGGSLNLIKKIKTANTGLQALKLCQQENLQIANQISKRAREVVLATLTGHTKVRVLIFDREGFLIGRSDGEN